MKRRILSLVLALVLLTALAVPTMADGPAVTASNQTITVDGKTVTAEVYNIDGSNYFKLRDVAQMLNGTEAQFSVSYDETSRTITANADTAYTPVGGELTVGEDKSATCVESNQAFAVNGIARSASVYNIGGNNFFKLRDLGALLGFAVGYDAETRTVVVDSKDASALSFSYAVAEPMTAKVDGKDVNITLYTATYVTKPNREADQKILIYIPENATKDSPIIFNVNNGGWRSDSLDQATKIEAGKDYDGTNDKIGVALKEGYVVVSYGARGRGDGLTGDEYLGHSPATMTDTKAAIRYLHLNKDLLPAGNTERIVITGTSGGGALSTVIAASGNSSDYFESLYEVGAAGITKTADGRYINTGRDDVYATIAYCPITDFRGADMAYEWTYNTTRERLYNENLMSFKGADQATVMENSKILADAYPAYVESLGLKDENGKPLTADGLKAGIIALMNTEIEESIKEIGIEQMKKDIADSTYNDSKWLTINDDGTYTYDYNEHLYFVARNTALKISCAFSNVGTGYGEFMNEDNLFGAPNQEYCPFEFRSWELDSIAGNGVGKDDTGLSWTEFLATDAGKAVSKQIRMTSAVDYLTDKTDDSTVAPYWYVRHGMKDRDTSFAVEGTLYYSMINESAIKDVDFEFAWLQPHAGNYDVAEAYAWLKTIL